MPGIRGKRGIRYGCIFLGNDWRRHYSPGKKGGALQSEAESAAATRPGIFAKLKFCSSEAIENLRDLAAESKMEWEAEKAAIEEARLHNKNRK